jgi:hypothetical protein
MATQISHILASSERWQKGLESVQFGSQVIQREIESALEESRGSLIGRHGTIELTSFLSLEQLGSVDSERRALLELHAGIFPSTDESVRAWAKEYTDATKESNVFAGAWYKPLAEVEWRYLQQYSPQSRRIPLRSLEPYYSMPDMSWFQALDGQHVAVVSSFAESMANQVQHLSKIWPQNPCLIPPRIQWSFVRSYYCPTTANGHCAWPSSIQSWQDAVGMLESQVLASGARIVLIGCGGLAMPLALRLKRQGKICIVLGGAIQLLFGLKGHRWINHPFISQLFNTSWKRPNHTEHPRNAHKIEGGCYW